MRQPILNTVTFSAGFAAKMSNRAVFPVADPALG
jgi:hypothetical protein